MKTHTRHRWIRNTGQWRGPIVAVLQCPQFKQAIWVTKQSDGLFEVRTRTVDIMSLAEAETLAEAQCSR